jgi:hypothetical protein
MIQDEKNLTTSWGAGTEPGSGHVTLTLTPIDSETWLGVMLVFSMNYERTERTVTLVRSQISLQGIPVSRLEHACRFTDPEPIRSLIIAGLLNGVPYSIALANAIDSTADDVESDNPLVQTFRDCWIAVVDNVYGVQ